VRVTIDGNALPESATVTPIWVDPGMHSVRYEHEGMRPFEEQVELSEGERGRVLLVHFHDVNAGSPAPTADVRERPQLPPPERPSPPPAAPEEHGIPASAWIFTGVGVLGVASFATFGIKERSESSACKPTCSQPQYNSIQTEVIVADVSLGVGVVALGVATWLIVSHLGGSSQPAASNHSVRFDGTVWVW